VLKRYSLRRYQRIPKQLRRHGGWLGAGALGIRIFLERAVVGAAGRQRLRRIAGLGCGLVRAARSVAAARHGHAAAGAILNKYYSL